METIDLRPGYMIPRLLKGNWQIAEDHSDREFDDNALMEDLIIFAEAGMSTYVCGDIYAGVEFEAGSSEVEKLPTEEPLAALSLIEFELNTISSGASLTSLIETVKGSS